MRNNVRFFGILVLLGMTVFVGAVSWNPVSYSSPYYFLEDDFSSYNFTVNLSDASDLSHFLILDIDWENGGLGPSHSDFYWLPWRDAGFDNSTSGVLNVSASSNNETGNFTLNVFAQGSPTGSSTRFYFIINATNDAPDFILDSNYSASIPVVGSDIKNISLVGSDEEGQYPLRYNVSFNSCNPANWSTRTNCSLDYFIASSSNTTSVLSMFNLTYNDVGEYNVTICVHDNINGSLLPFFYDDNYIGNKSSCQNTTLTLSPSFNVDVSDCNGIWVENETIECVINITTIGSSDTLNIFSYGFFEDSSTQSNNNTWFKPFGVFNSSNHFFPVNISVPLAKKDVGNWTINFTVDDGSTVDISQIHVFVNYTEFNVSLDPIPDKTIYDNNFSVNATDDDLLVWDSVVKSEILTFGSNTSWVNVVVNPGVNHNFNYLLSEVSFDYEAALLEGERNHTVLINVTDGKTVVNRTFIVEVFNETAPEWNLSAPVFLDLVENEAFVYNVSLNVSDFENDTISFTYQNISEEFCSLDGVGFDSDGMISFTPGDCDVGFHNVSIVADDGNLGSSWYFVFNISNVPDVPVFYEFTADNGSSQNIEEDSILVVSEDSEVVFLLTIDENDFLIPNSQIENYGYYNESLNVSVTINDSGNNSRDLFNLSFDKFWGDGSFVDYNVSFIPSGSQVDNYTIFIEVIDNKGNFTNRTFYLDIVPFSDAPELIAIDNLSLTVNDVLDLDINATDEEDGNDSFGALRFSLDFIYGSDFVNGDEDIFNTTFGVFNLSLNSSYAGEYHINVTVNDSEGNRDWQVFYLYVYDAPNVTFPLNDYVFNWNEGSLENMNFSVDYDINNTNLTYEFFMDDIVYYWINESNGTKGFNYTNLTSRENGDFTWNSSVNLSFDYTPNYWDETYGMLKNISLLVYNADYPELNSSFNWKVNINHTNENISFTPTITKKGPTVLGTIISVDLSDYFNDSDYFDIYYNQKVNFTLNTVGEGGYVALGSSFYDWTLGLGSSTSTVETINIVAYEWNDMNVSLGNVTSNDFEVEFIDPVIVTVSSPSSGGSSGSSTKLKYYSLRIISPEDVIISNDNYIEVPFGLENTGSVDLSGIDLSSSILYNNKFSDDIHIELEDTHLETLKVGERKEYTMKILADTSKSGKYKASIFANVTSPEFQDWGDFFIDLRRTNESEAEKLLIFTSKLIADNPECLELTEVFRRAQEAFETGNEVEAIRLATEVSQACEDAITANEQIRYKVEGFVEKSFYYVSFLTILIFFVGFIFYIYKRVKFNKYTEDVYVK